MTEKDHFDNMDDHDLLARTARDMYWLRKKTEGLCKEVYNEHPKEHKALNGRVTELEKHDSSSDAVGLSKRESLAVVIAVLVVIISVASIITTVIIGG